MSKDQISTHEKTKKEEKKKNDVEEYYTRQKTRFKEEEKRAKLPKDQPSPFENYDEKEKKTGKDAISTSEK